MASLQTDGPNKDQAEFWNSAVGETWVTLQPRLDQLFKGVTAAILDAAKPSPGQHVLDIGCGAGDLSLAVAQAGAPANVVALDISAPLLDHARLRFSANGSGIFETVLGDASTYPFAPHSFDLAVSRFGLMFFEDPAAGFAHLKRSLRPGARLAFAVWASLADNPWFTLPRQAAVAVLGDPDAGAPPPLPLTPGPFQLADREELRGVLSSAGYTAINIDTRQIPLVNPCSLDEAVELSTTIGPVSRIMRDQQGSEADLAQIRARLSDLMAEFVTQDAVTIPTSIHIVTAQSANP